MQFLIRFLGIFLFIFEIGKAQQQVWDHGCIYVDLNDASFGDVKRTNDNGFIAVGSGGNGEILLIKIDSVGNLQWAKFITIGTGTGRYRNFNANVEITSDGGYLITGEMVYLTGCGRNAVIVKTDGNGNVIWAREMGTASECSSFYDAMETSTGTYVAVGYTGPSSINQGEIYLTEWDNMGNLLYQARIGDNGANHDEGRAIVELDNGHYVIASVIYRATSDFYLIEFDPATNSIVKVTHRKVFEEIPCFFSIISPFFEVHPNWIQLPTIFVNNCFLFHLKTWDLVFGEFFVLRRSETGEEGRGGVDASFKDRSFWLATSSPCTNPS